MARRAVDLVAAFVSQAALRLRLQKNTPDAGQICHRRSAGLRPPGEIQMVPGPKPYKLIRRPLAANTLLISRLICSATTRTATASIIVLRISAPLPFRKTYATVPRQNQKHARNTKGSNGTKSRESGKPESSITAEKSTSAPSQAKSTPQKHTTIKQKPFSDNSPA